MKVLFLTHSFPRFTTDPVGSFVLRLAVALRGVGVDVRVIAPGASGLSAEEEYEGIPTERFRYAPRSLETLAYTGTMRAQVRSSWGGRLAMVAFLGAGVRKAWAVARRTRPDVIHAHWWFPSGVIGAWVSKVSGTPLVTTLHGSDLRLAQEHPFARRVARGVLRRSARVTTVSRWLAQGVRMIAPDVAPVVAPMPVVTELFHPGVTSARERDRLLFVGKLNEQKGINHLLRALPLMSHPAAVDVVVGVGSDETEARTLASSLGISGRLQWHPLLSQAELAGLYRKATALVIPSVDEGLGLVAVEALLSETPVVAFDSGGLPDVVLPGVTGLLVPPGRPDLLAQALDQLLAMPDRGAALGRAGRSHALAAFSPSSAAARYREIYAAVAPPRE